MAGRSQFWRYGVCSNQGDCPWLQFNYIAWQNNSDFLCCDSYDVTKVVPGLDALKIANVEYLVSVLPLTGAGLVQVSGPADGDLPPRRHQDWKSRTFGMLDWILHPRPAHIYRIPDVLPRAFVAGAIGPEGDGSDPLLQTDKAIKAGQALVAETDRPGLGAAGPGRISSLIERPDGYELDLDMPQGGVVVINAVWTPWWQAELDGQPVRPVRANLIHTALAVPAGSRHLTLTYDRPRLGRLLAARLGWISPFSGR